ncbi:MAG: hypothetical protein ACE5JS_04515 [Nitrospinota bacterium]
MNAEGNRQGEASLHSTSTPLNPGEFGTDPSEMQGSSGGVGKTAEKAGTLVPFFGRPGGLEALDDGDFFIPRYKLIQPGRQADGEKPGRFRLSIAGSDLLDGELKGRESLDVVPLKVQKGRVCWGEDTGTEPFCRSADNLRPDLLFWETRPGCPPSPVCGRLVNGRWQPVCPLAQWSGGERPPCHQVYNLLVLDAERRLPYLLSFQGAAVKPVRAFLTRLIRMRLKRLCDVRVRLSALKVEGPDITYFVPNFSHIRRNGRREYEREFETLREYDPRKTFEVEMADREESTSVARAFAVSAAY